MSWTLDISNPVRLNIQSLKYQTFTLSGCKDIEIWKIYVCGKGSIPLIILSSYIYMQPDGSNI